MSYSYPSLKEAKRAVSLVGDEIRQHGNPKRFDPMVFVFTGDGNVSKGAQEVFQQLPHKYITPAELKQMFATKSESVCWTTVSSSFFLHHLHCLVFLFIFFVPAFDSHVVYGLEINDLDYIRRKDGKTFDRAYYRSHPQEHYSVFHEEIAPYANVIVNGIYWETKYPKLISLDQAKVVCLLWLPAAFFFMLFYPTKPDADQQPQQPPCDCR